MAFHIRVLSIIFVVFGGTLLLTALANIYESGQFSQAMIIGDQGVHFSNINSGSFDTILKILLFIETYFSVIIGIPALIGGWGLYHRKAWGRYTLLILSLFLLLKFPIGTFIGLYALWALTKPETVELIHARELL